MADSCAICERCPPQRDDSLCHECREEFDRNSSKVTDPVERVLSAHWTMTPLCTSYHQVCRCGWTIDGGPAYHRRHLAEKVCEALALPGPAPWIDGPDVVHPTPRQPGVPDRQAEPPSWRTTAARALRTGGLSLVFERRRG